VAKAKALYAYVGQSTEELSVDVDDEVEIMDKSDPLWWRAKDVHGNSGMIPAAYLELKSQSTSG